MINAENKKVDENQVILPKHTNANFREILKNLLKEMKLTQSDKRISGCQVLNIGMIYLSKFIYLHMRHF